MLTIELVFLSLFPLLTILLSGLGVEMMIRKCFDSETPLEIRCIRIAVFGILWTTICFCFALLNISKNNFPNFSWSLLFLASTFLITGVALWINKKQFRELFSGKLLILVIGFSFFAILLECLSAYLYPHVFDATQLGWTSQFTDRESIQFGAQTGAVAYSSLIFFAGLLAPCLPLVISAAAVKIVIFFLISAVIYSISKAFYGRQFMPGIMIVAICVLGSPFGFLAISYGKDSILGVVLELAFLVVLAHPDVRGQFFNAALFSGVAALCGVISIPFTCVIVTLTVISLTGLKRRINFLAAFLLLTGLMFAFPLAVLLHHSWIPIAISSLVCGLFLFLVGHWSKLDQINLPRLPFWVPTLVVLASILASFRYLPILKVLPEFYGGDHGIVSPFDGKTGFLGLLYAYSCCSGFSTGVYLIAPIFALFLWRKRDPESWIPFFYLQLTMTLVLLSCHREQSILDASNQWDLIKDSMNYFLAPTMAMMLGPAIAVIPGDVDTRKSLTPFFIIVLIGSVIQSLSVYQMKTGEFYPCSQIGPFKYPRKSSEIPAVADFFYKTGGNQTLLVDPASGFPNMGAIQAFCPRVTIMSQPDILTKIPNLLPHDERPLFVITNSKTAAEITGIFSKDWTTLSVLNIPAKELVMIEVISKRKISPSSSN